MPPSRTRSGCCSGSSGFTLIELLTVIAIIAILMGLLLPVLSTAKNHARQAAAKNDLTQFVNAVKAFNTDYGTYPVDTANLGTANDLEYGATGDTHPNQDVVNVLRADAQVADTLSTSGSVGSINPRMVVYLDVPLVKNLTSPTSGLGTGSETGHPTTKGGEWYDPWGGRYVVAIDANYNGYIDGSSLSLLNYTGLNYLTVTSINGNCIQTGCIAASFGADKGQGVGGNKSYTNCDDVLSWQ